MDLDTNFGRLWELFTAVKGGEPSFAALESHYRALESYNPVLAREWADELREDYPTNPLAWARSYRNRSTIHGDPMSDSVRTMHRRKLDELIENAGAHTPSADELRWLALYAEYLEEPALRDSLLAELSRRAPDHPAVLDQRVVELFREAEFGTVELVSRLEEEWTDDGPVSELLIHGGVQAAAAAGLTDAARTWLDRGLRHPEIDVMELLDDIAPYHLAAERARLLRLRLGELASDTAARRPLRSSVAEYRAERRRGILNLQVSLADALIDLGDTTAAAALYGKTAGRIWRADDAGPYAEYLLARGDTTAAMPILGLLVADPVAGPQALETYADVIAARAGDVESFIDRSRAELARRILADLPPGPKLADDTRFRLLAGESTTAAEYLDGRPSVLFFWNPGSGDRSGLATFRELAAREWAGDIRAAVVISGPFDPAAITMGADRRPILVDSENELLGQIRKFALPLVVVVDPRLGIVATSSDAALAFRIAKSLTWTTP